MKGYIYKIVSSESPSIYIGSTKLDVNKRFSVHKMQYKNYLKQNQAYISSFDILKYPDSKIEIIEELICDSPTILREREKYHRELNKNNTVNKNSPMQTAQEKKQQMKHHNDLRKNLDYICIQCSSLIRLKSKYAHDKSKKHMNILHNIISQKKEPYDIIISFD